MSLNKINTINHGLLTIKGHIDRGGWADGV